jgi:L-rhamnose mutarotase
MNQLLSEENIIKFFIYIKLFRNFFFKTFKIKKKSENENSYESIKKQKDLTLL